MRQARRGDDSRGQAAQYNRAINAVEDQIGKVLRGPWGEDTPRQLRALEQRWQGLVRAFHVSIGAVDGFTESRREASAYTRECMAMMHRAFHVGE